MRKPTEQELKNYIEDTNNHINKVRLWLMEAKLVISDLALKHDKSKFSEEEQDVYAVVTPLFKGLDYGTKEHHEVGVMLGPAREHHIENNPHHVRHHENGVNDMDLMLILEMLCDWKASSERNPDQDFAESLLLNITKYGLDEQLGSIILNTAVRLGMIEDVFTIL